MALLRSFEDREYRPEYGTLLVRDSGPPGPARVRVGELLGEYAVDTQPCGSVARGGDGWLDGRATDHYHAVRLEAHDGPPQPDTAGWAAVVETPMATGGTVALSMVTGGVGSDPLRLGGPGLYRVRFARRPADEGDEYRLQFWPVAAPPEPPRWIARSAAMVEPAGDARRRFCYAASDVVALLLWAREAGAAVTPGWLADRLLAGADEVARTVEYAVGAGLIEGGAGPGGPDEPLALRVLPRRPVHRSAPPAVAVARGRPVHRQAPPGAPPRAGVVGADADLVVWRDGAPVTVGRWPGAQIWRALQARHGTVLVTGSQAALIRPDGEFVLLGADLGLSSALDPAGERLAVVESHLGRRSRARVHLIDLADGGRRTMPWDEQDAQLSVVAVHDGSVYVRSGLPGAGTLRWTPGRDPEPVPHQVRQVDPWTGVTLASDASGALLVEPGGATRRLAVDPLAVLAPGARRLYTWRYSPPRLVLAGVRAPGRETVIDLPGGSRIGTPAPGGPVWEDPDHVLVPAEHDRNDLGVPLVRVDVRTGAVEAAPLTPATRYRPVLVEPLPAGEVAGGEVAGGEVAGG